MVAEPTYVVRVWPKRATGTASDGVHYLLVCVDELQGRCRTTLNSSVAMRFQSLAAARFTALVIMDFPDVVKAAPIVVSYLPEVRQ